MTSETLRMAEEIASTCYRTKYTPPKPDAKAIEEAQRRFIAKAAARHTKRPDEGWGK